MRKRNVYLLLLAGALLAVVLALLFTREREPEYGGKRLSEWVDRYARQFGSFPGDPEPGDAIRHIGTNGLPSLLTQLFYKKPALKTKMCYFVNRIIEPINPAWQISDGERDGRVKTAYMALIELGPAAKGAIPALIHAGNDPQRAIWAGGVLTSLGEEAVPQLIACLTNQDEKLRLFATVQLVDIGTDSRPAVAALQRLLTDADPNMRNAVTNALLKLDPKTLERAAP